MNSEVQNKIKTVVKTLLSAVTLGLFISGCTLDLSPSPMNLMPPAFAMPLQNTYRSTAAKRSERNWQDEIIYFIFTDRFSNGDTSNDFNVNANDPYAYHGGDFQGIINKLDYIQDLGATSIWITPAVDNRDTVFWADGDNGKKIGIWGYHGYWTKDFYAVDEHLGTMAKFKELVQKAHQKGIKVILDMVMNHVDYDQSMAKDRNNPQSQYYSWFHHNGKITDFNNQWSVDLPDLAQENPVVAQYLIEATKWWIQQSGVDGLRLDTVKHVGRPFWQQFSHEIHQFAGSQFLLLGEVYDGRPDFCTHYLHDGLDSVFDFPLYYAIKDVFGQEQSMRQLGQLFEQDRLYPNPNLLSPFIDNHDVPRFVHEAGSNSREKLRLSLAFLMTVRGMPMIYYGTEDGMEGGPDPDNRRDMQWNKDPELRRFLQQLIQIRKNHPALRRGKQLEMWQDDQVYAFTRLTDISEEEVITVINNSQSAQTRHIPLRQESPLKNSSHQLANFLNAKDTIAINNGAIDVTIPPKTTAIYGLAQGK